jgi:hypothetical protein
MLVPLLPLLHILLPLLLPLLHILLHILLLSLLHILVHLLPSTALLALRQRGQRIWRQPLHEPARRRPAGVALDAAAVLQRPGQRKHEDGGVGQRQGQVVTQVQDLRGRCGSSGQ